MVSPGGKGRIFVTLENGHRGRECRDSVVQPQRANCRVIARSGRSDC